jgi:hypothetical protein
MKCGGLCRHSHMDISGSYRERGSRQARFPEAGTVWRSVLDVIGGKIEIQQLSSLSSLLSGAFTKSFVKSYPVSSPLQIVGRIICSHSPFKTNLQDETIGTARAPTSNGSEQHDSTTISYRVKTFEGDANPRRGMTWDLGSRRYIATH